MLLFPCTFPCNIPKVHYIRLNSIFQQFSKFFDLFLFRQLLFTHTCPATQFAVASHLNTANSCCHHVFLRHFRFQKCLPVNNKPDTLQFAIRRLVNLHTFLQIVSFFTIITLIIVLVYTFCRPDQLISYIK